MIVWGTLGFIAGVVALCFVVAHGNKQNYHEPPSSQRARGIADLIDNHSVWPNGEPEGWETRQQGYDRLQRTFNIRGKS